MSSPFIGEIKMFGGNFAPRGFAFCNGQILPLQQNTALFALLGTTFGGDGRTNFALPDLRGRVPLHRGQGPGLSAYSLGQSGGSSIVTLLPGQLPAHTHTVQADAVGGALSTTAGVALWSSVPRGHPAPYAAAGTPVPMHPASIAPAGGGMAHNNMSPYLGVSFIITLSGIFPARS
jgi:microcystin-dependent protein